MSDTEQTEPMEVDSGPKPEEETKEENSSDSSQTDPKEGEESTAKGVDEVDSSPPSEPKKTGS